MASPRSTTVLWATLAAADAMGQQRYEQEVLDALRARPDEGFRVRPVTLRSLRSRLPGDRRFPVGASASSSVAIGRLLGLAAYGLPRRHVLVHRLDLRLPPAPGREVLTIHDLAPLRFHDEGGIPRWSAASVRRAAAVICPSTFSAEEVRREFGVRDIHVVPYGVGAEYLDATPLDDAALGALGVRPPFVLHAGGASARKNLAALAGAWERLAPSWPGHQLVLTGSPHPNRTALFGGLPRTILLGRVASDVLPGLMARAEVVVVPSTYEGFGLPVLEAMACGTAVVAAAAASLPEVAGDAAILVDPDPAGLAGGLDQALGDEPLRQQLRRDGPARARRFTWAEVAERHLDVYRSLAE